MHSNDVDKTPFYCSRICNPVKFEIQSDTFRQTWNLELSKVNCK